MSLPTPDWQVKCDQLVSLVENDILTLDEARQALGYPPLPDELGRFTRSLYLNFVENIEPDSDFSFLNVETHPN
ncbi:MAG: hypothetical protein K2X66_03465 [Cyanobacteria bacterium]|jgi:hypothetical protein|nr:hypothetical protein [Cyanobacteriota bacterium]